MHENKNKLSQIFGVFFCFSLVGWLFLFCFVLFCFVFGGIKESDERQRKKHCGKLL